MIGKVLYLRIQLEIGPEHFFFFGRKRPLCPPPHPPTVLFFWGQTKIKYLIVGSDDWVIGFPQKNTLWTEGVFFTRPPQKKCNNGKLGFGGKQKKLSSVHLFPQNLHQNYPSAGSDEGVF